MINKLITSQTVVAKVIADLDLTENNIRISDMIEWVGEAIHKIGGITESGYKVDVIPLCYHQAKLPCDLNKLIQAAYSDNPEGRWYPMRYNTGSFGVKDIERGHNCPGCNTDDKCNCDYSRYVHDDILVKVYQTMYQKDNVTYDEALIALNTNDELRSVIRRLINNRDYNFTKITNYSGDIQYYVKPGYLVSNVPHGYIKLAYNYVPRDDNGYPLVPDIEAVIEAIYWYIVMKLQYPLFFTGKIPAYVYEKSEYNWKSYRKQAYGSIKMPNLDELESIKNAWNRIYPVMDEHDTFYSNVGERQIIYNRS